jgi:erythronate-4-phosphate dehydrogenase
MDTDALKKALKQGQIQRCVIDVWENEPAIDRELMDMSWISTMHIAGYSTDGKANGTTASVRAVARALDIPELFDWSPAALPEPVEEKEIDFVSLKMCALHTYDPRRDSEALKKAPDTFEELRGSYPLRREFQAFKVNNAPEKEKKILEALGFQIG